MIPQLCISAVELSRLPVEALFVIVNSYTATSSDNLSLPVLLQQIPGSLRRGTLQTLEVKTWANRFNAMCRVTPMDLAKLSARRVIGGVVGFGVSGARDS